MDTGEHNIEDLLEDDLESGEEEEREGWDEFRLLFSGGKSKNNDRSSRSYVKKSAIKIKNKKGSGRKRRENERSILEHEGICEDTKKDL